MDKIRSRFGSLRKRNTSMEESGEDHTKDSHSGSMSATADEEPFEMLSSTGQSSVRTGGRTDSLGDEKTDLTVFENQLTVLHEQLVAVMIDNQELNSKLREYEDTVSMQRLRMEIDIERKRYRDLEDKYSALETKTARDHHIHSHRTGGGGETVPRQTLEVAQDATEVAEKEEIESSKQRKRAFLPGSMDRMWSRVLRGVYETMDDFTEDPPEDKETDQLDGDPLTVKTLKENINRFGSALKPYISTVKGINTLLTWTTPSYTLLVFTIYMYTAWKGWLLPVVVILLLCRLFITYLQHHGFKLTFNYFDSGKESEKQPEESLGISDKFNLVLQVARKVQNGLKDAADSLEKIKSLLTWRHQATRQLFNGLMFVFILSCFLPSLYLFKLGGLAFGVKLFIINYFYNKYPRIKRKYDSSYKIWMSLPTDAQYQQECIKTELTKYVFVESGSELEGCETEITNQDKQFCELFSLPLAESPLSGWKGGRRCTLINKDKAFAAGLKNGKIYLTKSFICFERKTSPSPKNIVIPLTDIVKFQKCKPYSFLPGNGMAMEVVVTGNKTFIFGGILNRDEAYDHIMETGLENMLPWATGDPISIDQNDSGMSPITLRKRNNGGQKFRNFSLASEYYDSD
ncbi:GRAM domain-containing protein 4-like isoform X1 [Mizuhopecten yessoensis]|uniref:GRAM domain-containing protein 4-like isoform X1 n=1 Tax=Mizuhopecten yessoensis TaxID=6573 RepID=UPI000B458312|nr:GRAM domain-containing protein 4-like isoform X1 [Mizuhopecten yessoensis]XP_021352671.1 GRAM domain-containing protein 4-like isoform X1 [Mizuhopecten yessoensis]XP_021352679.1 GRAM domain-containing protein 4-like isoform X1 [Mizuhopecten yessoensis]